MDGFGGDFDLNCVAFVFFLLLWHSDTSDDDDILPVEERKSPSPPKVVPPPLKAPAPCEEGNLSPKEKPPPPSHSPSPRGVAPQDPPLSPVSPSGKGSKRRMKTKSKRKRVSDRDTERSPRSAAVTSKLMERFPGMKSAVIEQIVVEEKGWESQEKFDRCVARLERKDMVPAKKKVSRDSTHTAHVCPSCQKSFGTSVDLIEHLEVHAKQAAIPPKVKQDVNQPFPGIKVRSRGSLGILPTANNNNNNNDNNDDGVVEEGIVAASVNLPSVAEYMDPAYFNWG